MHRYIISGGGTGGHIFPALAIAQEIKSRYPEAAILFVGALGRMEMEKVPAAGFDIIGLPIKGIERKITLRNAMVPLKWFQSIIKARQIIKKFKPNAVIGVGGYASSAVLYAAKQLGIPSLIQEQNSFPGITNRLLAKRVNTICVAYEGMEQYFPKNKLVLTGNPVRQDILKNIPSAQKAKQHFGLPTESLTVLVIGGSLGALSINKALLKCLKRLQETGISLLWQTGNGFIAQAAEACQSHWPDGFKTLAFVKEMNMAYAAADMVVSRAGALAVSELCIVGKPSILVPYPYAAEDHQTKNAKALVSNDAAWLIKDAEVESKLPEMLMKLAAEDGTRQKMSEAIKSFAKPRATEEIVNEITKLENL